MHNPQQRNISSSKPRLQDAIAQCTAISVLACKVYLQETRSKLIYRSPVLSS